MGRKNVEPGLWILEKVSPRTKVMLPSALLLAILAFTPQIRSSRLTPDRKRSAFFEDVLSTDADQNYCKVCFSHLKYKMNTVRRQHSLQGSYRMLAVIIKPLKTWTEIWQSSSTNWFIQNTFGIGKWISSANALFGKKMVVAWIEHALLKNCKRLISLNDGGCNLLAR